MPARTRQLQRPHVSTYDRFWSTLPFLRLVTVTADSLADYSVDGDGGRVHDLLGTRCAPCVNRILTSQDFDFHSNLVRAVLSYGLTDFDIHDVLNVFQRTRLNGQDEYFMKTRLGRLPVPARHAPSRAGPALLRAGTT